MTPDELHILNSKYLRGAFVLLLPSGAFAVSDLRRREWKIAADPGETLDIIRAAAIQSFSAADERPLPRKSRVSLEDLGL